jgi:hypothetical protein
VRAFALFKEVGISAHFRQWRFLRATILRDRAVGDAKREKEMNESGFVARSGRCKAAWPRRRRFEVVPDCGAPHGAGRRAIS